MTAAVPSPTPPRADASHSRRRSRALAVTVALAVGAALVLLADPQSGPAWVHWGASLMTMAAACAVLAAAQLSWEHTVASAHAAGLVADPDDAQS